MRLDHLPRDIEVFDVGARRLYVKTSTNTFAIFEDELTPDELVGIAQDIAARRSQAVLDNHIAAPTGHIAPLNGAVEVAA